MEFLKVAVMAPMLNLGPVGMMIAVICWVIALYLGVKFGYGAKRPDGILYVAAFLGSAVMVAGLIMMLFTRVFDDEHGAVFQFFGLLQLLTFGAVGGFIFLMVASVGFMFGVLIRILDSMTRKGMR